MPYDVTVTAQVRAQRSCASCGTAWEETFDVSSTSGPQWRSGVKGTAQAMRASVEAAAEADAPRRGHVCPACGRLSRQALETLFREGVGTGILRLYDASLESTSGIVSFVACVFGLLLVFVFPPAGLPLLAIGLVFQIRLRQRFGECQRLRPHVAARLHEFGHRRRWLEQVAARSAMAGTLYPHGDFEPRLSWCWSVLSEVRKADADPSSMPQEGPPPRLPNPFLDDLLGD